MLWGMAGKKCVFSSDKDDLGKTTASFHDLKNIQLRRLLEGTEVTEAWFCVEKIFLIIWEVVTCP